jgi:tRNA pseudouridine13 synthase
MTIRRIPEDFVVDEVVSPEFLGGVQPQWSPMALHAVYRLTKTSITTPDACAYFARAMKVKPGQVDYTGLKDRHAVTTQLVSLRVDSRAGAAAMPDKPTGQGWSATRSGFSPVPASADIIDFNTFEVVVRRLQRRDFGTMDQRLRALQHPDSPSDLLFINYFGDQRFGSARHGEGFAARKLIAGDFDGALKLLLATPARKDTGSWRDFTRAAATHWGHWNDMLPLLARRPERAAIESLAAGRDPRDAFAALPHFMQQMAVEAYQSWLWNATASALARRASPKCFEADDEFGAMHFPPAASLDEAWQTLRVPTPGAGLTLHEPWGPALESVLAGEGLFVDDLRIPGLRRPAFGCADRHLCARASGHCLSDPEPDELSTNSALWKRTLRFTLPRGAYATVVLRALGQ